MATLISHAAVGALIGAVGSRPESQKRAALVCALAACVPDLDVIGFRFGVQYGDLWGHRGLTHSLCFAALLAALGLIWMPGARLRAWAVLFIATASHGLLDACTDGGLGVAFFAPFDITRYFFPYTPILVSPIGARFFSARGLAVLGSELYWIGLPCALLWMLWRSLRPKS